MGVKLAFVFVGFVALITTVIFMAFRERRLGKDLASDDRAGQQASDARILATIFTACLGGIVLTLLTAWIVFF